LLKLNILCGSQAHGIFVSLIGLRALGLCLFAGFLRERALMFRLSTLLLDAGLIVGGDNLRLR